MITHDETHYRAKSAPYPTALSRLPAIGHRRGSAYGPRNLNKPGQKTSKTITRFCSSIVSIILLAKQGRDGGFDQILCFLRLREQQSAQGLDRLAELGRRLEPCPTRTSASESGNGCSLWVKTIQHTDLSF
jgi:hypothetical protein